MVGGTHERQILHTISIVASHCCRVRADPGSTGAHRARAGPLTTLPVAARAPAVRGIADCTEQSAKPSNLMRECQELGTTAWQHPAKGCILS